MKLRKRRVEEIDLPAALLRHQTQLHAIARVDPLGVIERSRYIDVATRSARWAEVVHGHGIPRGEPVVVLAERDHAWRAALLGVIRAGCVAVPFPGTAPVEDIRAIAGDSGAALLLSARTRPDLDEGVAVVSADEAEMPPAARSSATEAVARGAAPDEPALMLYARDGGHWRGAVHTHGSLLALARNGGHWLGLGADERIWSTATDGSAESVWLLLAAWHAGAEIIVVDQLAAAEDVLELLQRLEPRALWLTDGEYRDLARADVPAWLELPSIRRALTNDARAPGVRAFHEIFGTPAAPVLATAEAGVVAGAAASPDELHCPGLTVVDEDGRELRAGEIGDLAVPGDAPTLFAGYGRSHENAPVPGQWFRVGRTGAIDPDGLLRLEPLEARTPVQEPDDDPGVAAHVAAPALLHDETTVARDEEKPQAKAAVEAKQEAERAEQERLAEARKREAVAAKAEDDRLTPDILSAIGHYGFTGVPADNDGRRGPEATNESPAG